MSWCDVCGRLQPICSYLNQDGTCSFKEDCPDMIKDLSITASIDTRRCIMRNLRKLHQEHMELKKLLLEIKQNQK